MYRLFLPLIILSLLSCNKLREYFSEPDTEPIVETLHTARLTGYAATIAMAAINGTSFPFTNISRSNPGFPCTSLIQLDLSDYPDSPAQSVSIAGLWADANTAVLSMIYTNYNVRSNVLEFVGIETIPVITDGNSIHVALASQEISLDPDQDVFLSVDLDNFQFQSELIRLDMPRPGDVYVAVTQNAYFIDVDTKGTLNTYTDDNYTVTGGGQLIEVQNSDAEIIQQAAVEISLSSECIINPVSGMALIRVVDIEGQDFPELGTALLQFTDNCDGKAYVYLATGIYATKNGKNISFTL